MYVKINVCTYVHPNTSISNILADKVVPAASSLESNIPTYSNLKTPAFPILSYFNKNSLRYVLMCMHIYFTH